MESRILNFFYQNAHCSLLCCHNKKKYYSETREATAAKGNWQGKSKFVYLSQ